jgi:hypothetical protein
LLGFVTGLPLRMGHCPTIVLVLDLIAEFFVR